MKKRGMIFLLCASLLAIALFGAYSFKRKELYKSSQEVLAREDEELSSHCAVMIDISENKICYAKNSKERVPVASLTKIMTALVAIENLNSLSREFIFTEDIIEDLKDKGSAMAGFKAGERVSANDMLYGLMLPSGGDAAVGISVLASSGTEEHIARMNSLARELGMKNTHFSDVAGLDDANNYSSAEDMAILFCRALQNPLFKRIITTREYLTRPTKEHPNGILLKSTLSEPAEEYELEDKILGGKTGYTTGAGLCLATYAEKNGHRYVLITLGAGNGSKYPSYHFEDAAILYDEYFVA